jgi:hypothetical protein
MPQQIDKLSPTQIQDADGSTREGCLRKWHFRRVQRLETPGVEVGQESRDWGEEGHEQLATYLRGGERPSRPDVLRLLPLIPEPGRDLFVEEYLSLTIAGQRVTAKLDLAHARRLSVARAMLGDPGLVDPADTVEVADWKFSSSRRYLPTTPAGNLQMALYAEAWLERGAPAVRQTLAYIIKSPQDLVPVTRLVRRGDLRPELERAAAVVERMLEAREQSDPERVPGNPQACAAYGGCPYLERCSVARFDPLRRVLGDAAADEIQRRAGLPVALIEKRDTKEQNVSILDRINKGKSAPATPAPTAAEAAASAAEERRAALPEDVRDAADYLETSNFGCPPTTGRAAQAIAAAKRVTVAPRAGLAGRGELGAHPTVEDPAELVTIAAQCRAVEAGEDAERAAAQQHPASVSPPDAPASDPATHTQDAEKKKAARKEKTAAARERAAPTQTAATVADQNVDQAAAEGLKSEAASVIVLVDCAAVSGLGGALRLEPYCYQALRDAAVAGGAAPGVDPRLSTGEVFGYGRWRALVTAAVTAAPPKGGTWLLDSRGGELAEAVIEGLVRAGVAVVRGHR